MARVPLMLMVALVVFTGCGGERAASPKVVPADVAARIDTIVRARMDAGLLPGAVVSVIDPERGTFTRAYGQASISPERRMETGDHFRVASVTKTFTATAILRLADEEKLALNDPVEKYVPGVPNGPSITIANLLGMRGGVYDYAGDPEFVTRYQVKPAGGDWTTGDALRVIKAHPEKAQRPDSKTVYSNSEYVLLGLVIEKVTGRPVRDAVNDVSRRLDLSDTFYPAGPELPAPASHGYEHAGDVLTDVTARTPPGVFAAAGAVVSTVPDLAKYAPELGRGQLLKPQTQSARTQFTKMDGPGGLEYGLGIARQGKWLIHSGGVRGYSTMVAYLPESGAAMAIAVNRVGLPATMLPIGAPAIWNALAAELYPGSVPSGKAQSPSPPPPGVAELNAQLKQALDPGVPADRKALKIVDDAKDPALMGALATAIAGARQRIEVTKVTDLGRGQLTATTVVTTAGKARTPMTIPFQAKDGAWRLVTEWACLASGAQQTSPACK